MLAAHAVQSAIAPTIDSAVAVHAKPTVPQEIPASLRDAHVKAAMARFHVPGDVFAVRDRDGNVFKTAMGESDVENHMPSSPADHYEIRSITKSFTVTLILGAGGSKILVAERSDRQIRARHSQRIEGSMTPTVWASAA